MVADHEDERVRCAAREPHGARDGAVQRVPARITFCALLLCANSSTPSSSIIRKKPSRSRDEHVERLVGHRDERDDRLVDVAVALLVLLEHLLVGEQAEELVPRACRSPAAELT